MQVGIDMSKFREFPYRGSLLQSQNGSIQEVRHSNKLISAMVASTYLQSLFKAHKSDDKESQEGVPCCAFLRCGTLTAKSQSVFVHTLNVPMRAKVQMERIQMEAILWMRRSA